MIDTREIRHFHLFCGLGGGAAGFNRSTARVGNLVGKFRCIGGIDVDAAAMRDFSTLELAAIQSLVDPEEQLELDGLSDSAWRERIGNAVPPDAATAIGNVMGTTLLLAWSGETFVLSASPIWVQPIAVALSVQQGATA